MVELSVIRCVLWPVARFKIDALMLSPHMSREPTPILKFCSTKLTYHHCSDLHYHFNTMLLHELLRSYFYPPLTD